MNGQQQVQVLSRSASRELDALIAEKVMGYVWHAWDLSGAFTYLLPPTDTDLGEECIARRRDGVLEPGEYRGPRYSTDIAAAWLVVEKMHDDGWLWFIDNYTGGGWTARAERDHNDRRALEIEAESAPIAICRAALAAVEAV